MFAEFRTRDARHGALAELLRMLRKPLFHAVGKETGDDVRRARHDADDEAHDRAARDRHGGLPPLFAVRQKLAQLGRMHLGGDGLARCRENFAKPEQAHRDRHDADAVAQFLDVEGIAEMAGHHVDADTAQQQADTGHQQRARERCRRHVGEEHEAEHEKGGVFRRAESQSEGPERRRNQGEHDHAEGAGDERAHRGDTKGRAATSLLRHGVTVDAGHHRGGFARDPHQDGGGRAAVLRAVIDAGEHDDGLGGVEAEGDRQKNADARKRTDAGQHADQGADHAAEKGVEQHIGPEGDRKAEQNAVERRFHS